MKRLLVRSAILIGYILLVAVVFFLLVMVHCTFSVKNVLVSVRSGTVTQITGITDFYGKNLLVLSAHQAEIDLQKRNSALQSISVAKEYPSTLKISVAARNPLVALQVSDNGVFILDRDGVILQRQQNYTGPLPLLQYYQAFQYGQYRTGDAIDYKDLVTTLSIVDELGGYGYPSQRIDIDGQYMIRLTIIDKKTFFFTSEKDKEIQMYQLKELLRQFKIQGRDFKTIDLRFDKPVITIR